MLSKSDLDKIKDSDEPWMVEDIQVTIVNTKIQKTKNDKIGIKDLAFIEEIVNFKIKSKKAEIESDINTKKASYDADKNQRIRDLRDKKPATDNRDTCDSVSAIGYLDEFSSSVYNYWDVCFYNDDTSEGFCDTFDISNADFTGYYNSWNLNYSFSAGTWTVDLYQYAYYYNYNDAYLFLSFEDGPVSYTHLTLPTKRIV